MSTSPTYPEHLFERTRGWHLILASIFLVASIFYFVSSRSAGGFERSTTCVERVLAESDETLEREMQTVLNLSADSLFGYFNSHCADYEREGKSYFVYQDDELTAWSSSSVPGADQLSSVIKSGPTVLLGNGWYLIRSMQVGERTAYGLFLIKYEYLYQNKYLVNNFHPHFGLEEEPKIGFSPTQQNLAVKDSKGELLFYLEQEQSPAVDDILGGGVLLGVLLFFFVLCKYLARVFFNRSSRLRFFIPFVAILFGLRAIMLYVGWPWGLSDWYIFDATAYFRSSLFPSIGDLLINAYLFLLLTYTFKEWVKSAAITLSKPLMAALLVAYMVLARQIDKLFRDLIRDSSVEFNIDYFFDLDVLSLLGVSSMGMLLLATLFIAQIMAGSWSRQRFSWRHSLAILLTISVAIILIDQLSGVVDMVKVLWAWVLFLYLIFTERLRMRGPRLVYILGALALISFYGAHTFEKQLIDKDQESLQVMADRLMEGGDPVAEYLFDDMREDLEGDSLLWQLVERPTYEKSRLLDQLRKDYFNGYWTKYDINVQLQKDTSISLTRYQFITDSLPIGFYKVPGNEIEMNYVMKVAFSDAPWLAYVDFELNVIPDELGFPELLIEGGSILGDRLSRYSFAQYHDGELVDQYGDYEYRLQQSNLAPTHSAYYVDREFWHYPFRKGMDAYIISTPRNSFTDRLTTFTYLFCFIGLMLLIAYVIEYVVIERRFPRPDLQNKVQFLVVSILFSSLLVFGVGAYYYIISQNRANNESLLSEKVSSVLIELGQKLEKEQAFGDKEKVALYLEKFAKVFFTDINLYTLDGELLASSRPQIFSRGLISTRMDPEAYRQMALEKDSRFIHQERIGGLQYLSAYVPFMDSENNVLAYLNLPYFAKQTELEDELSSFLVAVINVLVLLFVLAILIGVLVSNWITRPLQLLKDNLAAIRIDRRNQPIEYDGTDEIASLVTEYNNRVAELQRNAELLAKSERESAWREMAKQVAHEIKNPLTPMKLSIQYLQRSHNDPGPDWDARFQRSSAMLIEQIDTLSGIATAFSDFAKMPKAINEHFSISLLLRQTAELFAEQPDADLTLSIDVPEDAQVFADSDQIGRMLTNLIKNAIQSIPDGEPGEVDVSLISKGHQFIIEVKDNGSGIPRDMQDRIFVPNFTTKTTGTGLGLAMSKNIVEQAEGEIWFVTQEGQGTSFYVSLPVVE